LTELHRLAANLNAQNQDGLTPAQLAQDSGYIETREAIDHLLMLNSMIGSNGLFSQQSSADNKRNHGPDDEDQEHEPSNSKKYRP
jgi:hypothetical protein